MYVYEVVVRPLKDGNVQYVSNRIISPEPKDCQTWYKPRQTRQVEEKNSRESAYWFIPQSENCLLSEEEEEKLQRNVLYAVRFVRGIYKDFVGKEKTDDSSGAGEFTRAQKKAVVDEMGENGYTSVGEVVDYTEHKVCHVNYLFFPFVERRERSVSISVSDNRSLSM